jgi:hypothetical protein
VPDYVERLGRRYLEQRADADELRRVGPPGDEEALR